MNKSPFNSKYKQGVFKPQHPEKYIGVLDLAKFRSSYEFLMCQYFDSNDRIIRWGIEQPKIDYWDLDNQHHTYYPDFYYEIKVLRDNSYTLDRVIVEVKPAEQIYPPVKPVNETNKSLKNYEYAVREHIKNKLKWNAALEFAEKNHYKFILITQETLKEKGILKS